MASAAIVLASQIDKAQVGDEQKKGEGMSEGCYGICAICLEKISIQEAALVKGCEHAYCVTCILRWATYHNSPSCPQCKLPFDALNIHRSLDGCIHDYMFEESVCLLLRATWFVPLSVESIEEMNEEPEDLYHYYYEGLGDDEEVDDLDDAFYFSNNSSNVRLGNRRWGDNGYVRAGRKEARPIIHESDVGSSRNPNTRKEDSGKELKGRRAKRAMKREAADKAAAAKHEQHLLRFGRK